MAILRRRAGAGNCQTSRLETAPISNPCPETAGRQVNDVLSYKQFREKLSYIHRRASRLLLNMMAIASARWTHCLIFLKCSCGFSKAHTYAASAGTEETSS